MSWQREQDGSVAWVDTPKRFERERHVGRRVEFMTGYKDPDLTIMSGTIVDYDAPNKHYLVVGDDHIRYYMSVGADWHFLVSEEDYFDPIGVN